MKPNRKDKRTDGGQRCQKSELARQMDITIRNYATAERQAKWWKQGYKRAYQGIPKSLWKHYFLPTMYPNVNTDKDSVSIEKPPDIHQPIPAKHPDAHQLACTVNEDDGLVEIKQGKYVTTLAIPPGPISIKYSTNN